MVSGATLTYYIRDQNVIFQKLRSQYVIFKKFGIIMYFLTLLGLKNNSINFKRPKYNLKKDGGKLKF